MNSTPLSCARLVKGSNKRGRVAATWWRRCAGVGMSRVTDCASCRNWRLRVAATRGVFRSAAGLWFSPEGSRVPRLLSFSRSSAALVLLLAVVLLLALFHLPDQLVDPPLPVVRVIGFARRAGRFGSLLLGFAPRVDHLRRRHDRVNQVAYEVETLFNDASGYVD